MELVDRYLNAVKFWLPRKEKDDIIAELSEELRSQIEEKESDLGHALSTDEIESILKRSGAPMFVAQRYLPQRFLIGPTVFSIYCVALRSLFLYFLLPWFLLWLGIAIFSPDSRAHHPDFGILASLDPWWIACTHAVVFDTLAFVLLDRLQMRSGLLDNWNPRSLPAVRDPNRIPRSNTIIELTASVAGLALWVQLDPFRRVFHMFGITITLAHPWPYLIWALTILSGAGIALACRNLQNPRWTRLSASLRLGIDTYSWGLIYWLCRANLLESLSGNDITAANSEKLVGWINLWMARSAIYVMAIGVIVLIFDIRRIIRVGRTT